MKATRARHPEVRSEWRWAVLVSLGIVFLASVPYLFGYAIAPRGHRFIGLTYNVDDALVYLSWMRQAADGHFFTRNLFTSEPQVGHGFNLLFYALGRLAGFTHLPLIAVFHLARVVFGVGLLVLVYGFGRLWIPDLRGRRVALLIAGLSSGLGWLVPIGEGFNRSVDLWQPEAITFLSIYLSPLFSFSLILTVGSLYLLCLYSRTGMTRYPVFAGLLLLLLGNVHSYDVIPAGLAWALYALVNLVRRPRNVRPAVGGLMATVIGAPSVAYQAYIYAHEPVFRLRADVPTLSPSIIFYVLGFGLLIPLAVIGIRRLRSERADWALLVCWIFAAIAAAYMPISFQRKLIMGVHIPLSVCAAAAFGYLADTTIARRAGLMAVIVVLLLGPSNAVFMMADMSRITANEAHTTAHSPFISEEEITALEYLRRHADPEVIVLAQPYLASLVPAWTGRVVYCGHWGETARFEDKLSEVLGFFGNADYVKPQQEFLRQYQIGYVVDYNQLASVDPAMTTVLRLPNITVYRSRH